MTGTSAARLVDLRVENSVAPLALWTPRPRFSWVIDTAAVDVSQRAYELQLSAPSGTVLATGRVDSPESVLVELLSDDLVPATTYSWRVRVWLNDADSPTGWAEAGFETARWFDAQPSAEVWHGAWLEPVQSPVIVEGATTIMAALRGGDLGPTEDRLHPPQRIRQRFTLRDKPVRARLRATAQGVYSCELNGTSVGDEVLAPGYESYQHGLSVQTYDVTGQVQAGENALGLTLADGWFAGRISIFGRSAQYGDLLRASWQLEVGYPDGSTEIIASDGTARSSDAGPIRYSDLFIGEYHDARVADPAWSTTVFDDSAWLPVRTSEVSTPLRPFVGEPIRRVLELPATDVIHTPAGETVIDFGQVIAGRVRLRVSGPAGTEIRLEHGEVLDQHGNYLNNISGLNKDQTDVYVLSGDPEGETWEPEFTFHGFRYCRVTGYPGTPSTADFTAVVLASDIRETSGWRSSDERLNQLHRNVVWSQRGNFLSVPTDCPQRERAGWTGDAQIFMPTAATNADVTGFMARWLGDVRLEQDADGGIPIIVPMPPIQNEQQARGGLTGLDSIRYAAGWSDAIVMIPHLLWRRFRDRKVLRENYDAMLAWAQRQRQDAAVLPARLRDQPLEGAQAARQALLWNGLLNFGDWLAPSTMDAANPGSIMQAPLRTAELVGPMFQANTLTQLAEIAAELGKSDDAATFAEQARQVREAFATEYVGSDGSLPEQLQGVYVLALAFDMVPEQARKGTIDRLVELVHGNGDRLDTGFLSVPYLLDVLADTGHADLARTLLWQDACPSWLYEVDRGATTIWEAWDAIAPDGTVGVMSFNHYAFGCVDDWLFRRLAGLREAEPGFRRSVIAPDLDAPLDDVAAHIDTPYGRLAVTWSRDGDQVTLEVQVPANTRARVEVPLGYRCSAPTDLGSGSHTLRLGRAG